MLARAFDPARFLRSVAGTAPFRAYCAARGLPLEWAARGDHARRWASALAGLPPDAQARVELELVRVAGLAGRGGNEHLLEAARDADGPPGDDVPAGAPLALWFLLNRPDVFHEASFHHAAAGDHAWRAASVDAGGPVDPARAAAALGPALRAFFRRRAGTGRFCVVDARRVGDAVWFAARVSDRVRLVEAFTGRGRPAVRRVRPAVAVLFAYAPADGSVLLRSPLRSADRARELAAVFAAAALGRPLAGFGEAFDLDRLKGSLPLLPDAPDMEGARVKALHLRYPARLGRRGLVLDTLPGDHPDAVAALVRAHAGGHAADLAVWHAEIEVRLRADGRARAHLIRLWPDRCNLGRSPLGERLRRCLARWGVSRG